MPEPGTTINREPLHQHVLVAIASTKVVKERKIGGSPDMGQLSRDGKQFGITGRYLGEIAVIDTTSGQMIRCFALRRRAPQEQPMLAIIPYHRLPKPFRGAP